MFIESQVFTKFVGDYLDDDEYSALQHHMLGIRKQGQSFVGLEEFANSDGGHEEKARVAVYG